MLLKRMYDDRLAQASYLVGCQATGEAVVIDPNRDARQYLEAAAAEGLRITHVTETHIHADFLSGTRELAAAAGARMILSREGGADWQYRFATKENATLAGNGHLFRIGNIAIEAVHTPGHTPEHMTFLVTDTPASDRPVGAFTGDFIFAGDVGRPDLLERAAHVAGTMEASARTLFHSLRRFRAMPPYLQLWPGHGAGSACGKALGAMPQTTLGYELIANWAFGIDDEDTFVRAVLEGQPEPPRYFAEMKRLNRDGPPLLDGFREPPLLDASRLAPLLESGAVVIDTRRNEIFAKGHVPGTLGIQLSKSFSTYVGSVVPFDADLYLIVDDGVPGAAARAARDLAMIGLDRVAGVFAGRVIAEWSASGRPLGTVKQMDVSEAARLAQRGELALVDVRGRAEYAAGHPAGAPNVPYAELAGRRAELPARRPLALICQSGSRSAIGASLLRAGGLTEVVNVAGGFDQWERAGLPVERA
ncbi:MAG TPA: MBL fold metallo-hydrolase [Gemmatimonadaceae bacterium]|nr:MBL fold metallo-hydrolase [Gemmatimonadaceae bacterium]